MPAIGKVTMKKVGEDVVVPDESGRSFTIPGSKDSLQLDIDPRIDLTKPIWEQVKRLRLD